MTTGTFPMPPGTTTPDGLPVPVPVVAIGQSGADGSELASLTGRVCRGIDDGATICCGRRMLTTDVVRRPCTACAADGGCGVKDAGGEICSQRTSGGRPTQIKEIASSKLRVMACMVNDASVVHPR